MRKRISKRRWKARFKLGKWIPQMAVIQHRLHLEAVEYNLLTNHVRKPR